ncbi:MAG: hypothetical protein ASARMPRED_003737 [Alectoria sarmentosa]|nr:MAG: hypothetical protein ASARMPRED_003737 [Alectoria sarmentosa]
MEEKDHSPDVISRASINSAENAPPTLECPPTIDEKALLRKIDIRVIPILFLLYLSAFLDRVNIANALTLRLPQDLHLKGNESNVALTIFFVPYVLFEIPSNVLLKSFWYKREESQRRFTVFWSSVLFASMFGGLLASAIANMHGVRGYSSWRWIFILEGIATIVIGIGAYFLVADFPADARWLSAEEKEFVIARTETDEKAASPITVRKVVSFFGDVKNVIGGFMYFAVIVPIYSYSYFAPTIVKTLGYSTVETQLHTVPPAAAALALCLILAYLSDRLRLRFPFILLGFLLTTAGLAILLTTHRGFHVRYLGICLVAMGCFSAGPIIVCWYVMNLNGHADRSIGSAWMIGFGNTGGLFDMHGIGDLGEQRLRKRKLMVTAVQKKTKKRINERSTVRMDNIERLLRTDRSNYSSPSPDPTQESSLPAQTQHIYLSLHDQTLHDYYPILPE